ncbi:Do family serine endopeptidase [Pseudochelatococcus contaminans]|uniref:Probable periplasmic serine endoprotease DegP-like n=1 Tax=Pseudochelatococcus contaminans TaxID=1538103 RepID=A0A7W6EHJ6_9HYPH|nr:Do family serine endopeptidase [Pseudochelatococcus contaminans]MBB3809827.1 serine protease Do [Pseudochelatococcus contaminans]
MPDNNTTHSTARRPRVRSMLLGAVALAALAGTGTLANFAFNPPAAAIAQNLTTSPATPVVVPGQTSFADLVDKVKPAVVSVRVKIPVDQADQQRSPLEQFGFPPGSPFEEFFRRFGSPDQEAQPGRPGRPERRGGPRRFGEAQGSGFFISEDGYIVTNNHVVDKSSEVEVRTDDGKSFTAKVIGTDPRTDIALLKVDEKGPFPFVSFGEALPRVGDWVLAVGNPFGLGGTVTAGIVSARGRDIGAGPYDDFLQIDASVNKGNSGGPAFDLAGNVVGVNTAIASPSGGSVGIAFAIPAETVQKVVSEIRDHGTVRRGFLGVQIQPVTEDIASSIGLPKAEGAIVARVENDSPADKAGVKTGDAITAVNGKAVKDARELSREIAGFNPDTTVKLQVWRDGKERTVDVQLTELPGDEGGAKSADQREGGSLGLRLAPSGSVGGAGQEGVVVVGVEPESAAEERGFRTGDVILEVSGQKVENPGDVRKAVEAVRKDGKRAVLFRVQSQEGTRFIALPVGE